MEALVVGRATRRDAGSFGWGVAWFVWNIPIALAAISLVFVAVTLADQVSSGDGVDVSRLAGGYLLAVPCFSFLGWLGGSSLIAAVWATGTRNHLLARLPVVVVPALFAVPASENGLQVAFYVCSGLALALALRLPEGSGTIESASVRGTGG
ncbi:hypothetical protein ABZ807_10205 [Micromonospora sp. NPDC047548]|uniref:hypothetical protein n=1 Tax=Micromonospora sp. NPDC047548 TaxID=3155624 RepID=UPI0034079033